MLQNTVLFVVISQTQSILQFFSMHTPLLQEGGQYSNISIFYIFPVIQPIDFQINPTKRQSTFQRIFYTIASSNSIEPISRYSNFSIAPRPQWIILIFREKLKKPHSRYRTAYPTAQQPNPLSHNPCRGGTLQRFYNIHFTTADFTTPPALTPLRQERNFLTVNIELFDRKYRTF